MEPLTPGRVTSRAGSPSLSHRAFPPFCPQPPHGAPSSLLCSPQLCQRDGLPVPFQIPAFLMRPGVRQVWASHTPSRLAAPCSRNGFVILRTGGSPSVALHPALRQRSYFRFRVGGAYPEGTCTPLTLRLGGALGAGRARDGRRGTVFCSHRLRRTPERPGLRSHAETWERSNVVASGFPVTRWKAGPARRTVRGRTGIRGRKQPFGAEPVGGVRNREQGASCLSAASSCPAGSAARRPGSSQRQGCPFFWFFSLGRQRKERHPARGRCHPDNAGASR